MVTHRYSRQRFPTGSMTDMYMHACVRACVFVCGVRVYVRGRRRRRKWVVCQYMNMLCRQYARGFAVGGRGARTILESDNWVVVWQDSEHFAKQTHSDAAAVSISAQAAP